MYIGGMGDKSNFGGKVMKIINENQFDEVMKKGVTLVDFYVGVGGEKKNNSLLRQILL